MSIEKIISNYCVSKENRKGNVLHRGSAANYLGFDRHLSMDFKPMHEAFNGYREEYFSEKQLCNVGTCEGDVTVTIYDSAKDYKDGYKKALKFYAENA